MNHGWQRNRTGLVQHQCAECDAVIVAGQNHDRYSTLVSRRTRNYFLHHGRCAEIWAQHNLDRRDDE